jgi:hypothetical protein
MAIALFLVVIAVLAWVLFVFFTERGRGILFGGRIVKTYEGVAAKRKILSHKVRVHAVESGLVRFVGLEISTSSIGSYSMIPLTLPAPEARQLAHLLLEAAEYKEA